MRDDRREDEVLKKAIQQIYENIEIPDSTESWKRVQKRLAERRRRKRWLTGTGYIAAVLIGSFIISNIWNQVPRVYSFSGLFKNIKESVVEIFHEEPPEQDHSQALTPPPAEEEAPTADRPDQMRIVTQEEAQSKLAFNLQLPEYIPDDYNLHQIRIFGSQDGAYNSALIQYVNADGHILHIMHRLIEGVTDGLKNELSDEEGHYIDVLVNDIPALLMIPNEGNLHLEWLNAERVLLRISGDVSQDEILAIARSFN